MSLNQFSKALHAAPTFAVPCPPRTRRIEEEGNTQARSPFAHFVDALKKASFLFPSAKI
jgi:hypothetical protein